MCLYGKFVSSQNHTEIIDTFYVQTPEFSQSLNLDSLFFPCAITKPNTGTKFPALVLVHGTSALDKDANSTKDFKDFVGGPYRKAQTRMFYDIGHHLAESGVVVLRYDKRSFTVGCIEQPSCWFADTVTPYDYIKDANEAVNYVKSLSYVDTCNIFIAGHSQGGSFVTKMGYDRPDIRGVISLAQTALPIDSVSVYQTEFVNGDPSGAITQRQQFDSLRAGTWPMSDTIYNAHFSPRFWLDWISHTDSAIIAQKDSDKASLIMYGTADRFVPPTDHLTKLMDSVTRPDASFALFQDFDHSFNTEYDSTTSVLVIDSMQSWIMNNSIDCITGIEDSKLRLTKIYPNPVSDVINIEFPNRESYHMRICNYDGKLLEQFSSSGQIFHRVNAEYLKSGVYFLIIESQSDSIAHKFIIE